MEASINLGRIKNIPIGLHWSLLLVFSLLTWSLARGYFPEEYPSLPASAHWFLAVMTSMLTLRDIAAIPQPKWRFTTVEQAMVPLKRLTHVQPNLELLAALQIMDKADVAQVPVIEGDNLVGLLSREQVLHYIRTRAELGI